MNKPVCRPAALSAAIGLLLAASIPLAPAHAQTTATCMNNPALGNAMFPVPPASVADMQARGFTQIPCGDGFTAGLQNFRDGMCAMAAQAPDAAKTKFATTFGVTPQEACDMATAVLNSQNGS